MSAPPYMKLYVADYLGDTYTLSVVEHGAYLLLLMGMWRAGGKLPADDAKLARVACCSPEQWAEVKGTVLAFFRRRGGLITHKRLSEELAKYETVSERRREAQKAGEAKRTNKTNDVEGANAGQTECKSPHNQNQNQNQIREGSDEPSRAAQPKRARRAGLTEIPEGFPNAAAIVSAQLAIAAAGAALDVQDQARRFRSHALSNGRTAKDWLAAWMGWVEREAESAPRAAAPRAAGPTPPPFGGPEEVVDAVRASLPRPEYTGSYLAACTWRDLPERALVCSSPTIFAKLKDCERALADTGVRLLFEGERAA